MAKISTFTMTLIRKVSDGKFGTYGCEVTTTVELEEGEKVRDVGPSVTSTLQKQLMAGVEASFFKLKGESKPDK